MKKGKLLFFALGFCAISYAYPDISIQLKDNKSLLPSVYKLGVAINYSAQSSDDVVVYLGRVDSMIRSLNIPYKGGNFSILKNCFYNNNKYICEGYKGIDSYTFYMKNPKDQDKLLNALKGINYQITYSGFVVPKEEIDKAKDYLVKDLAKKSIDYALEFSKIFNKDCFVKSLSYAENTPRPIAFAMAKTLPLPAISKQNVSMSAFVNISCR
ncbi:MAG: hypothetical protein ACP5LI_05405 [Hydrogenobaculum sp.]